MFFGKRSCWKSGSRVRMPYISAPTCTDIVPSVVLGVVTGRGYKRGKGTTRLGVGLGLRYDCERNTIYEAARTKPSCPAGHVSCMYVAVSCTRTTGRTMEPAACLGCWKTATAVVGV